MPDSLPLHQGETFLFRCSPQTPCFLTCCSNVDLLLFPYDILRLRQRMEINATAFLTKYAELCPGSHDFFPGLRLKMLATKGAPCPFLAGDGCTVYIDRPSACRTYPLERAVERERNGKRLTAHYFLTHHPYCKGHEMNHSYTLKQWEREQDLYAWNTYNDAWAELDAFFATNPWAGEGEAGPKQQLAFMVCYNIDAFRDYSRQHALLSHFSLPKEERRRIERSDEALLLFGFKWLEWALGGRKMLAPK